jgi:hypothetical protein
MLTGRFLGSELQLREKNCFLTVVTSNPVSSGRGRLRRRQTELDREISPDFSTSPASAAADTTDDNRNLGTRFIFARQCQNLRPILFARAVDDHFDAGLFAVGQQFTSPAGKTRVLQMIVRVVKNHFAVASAN